MALAVATGWCAEPPKQLDKANVLPLALDDHFEFRKEKLFLTIPSSSSRPPTRRSFSSGSG